MSYGSFNATVTDSAGNAIAATITVTNSGGDLISLFSDAGTTSISNPYSVTDGAISFYCESQAVNVSATDGSTVKLWSDVVISGTAATLDVGTSDGEIPTNGDLGSAATRDVGAGASDLVERSEIESLVNANAGKTVTVNFDTDADITLDATQNTYGRIVITDTSDVLTTERQIIVSADERFLTVKNETDYDIKIVTSAGTGVHVTYGEQFSLRSDGTNILTNGTANVVEILENGTYAAGLTFSYPNGRSESDYSTVTVYCIVPSESTVARGDATVTNQFISANLSSWELREFVTTINVTRYSGVAASTSTTFATTSSGTDVAVSQVTAKLKDGVSY